MDVIGVQYLQWWGIDAEVTFVSSFYMCFVINSMPEPIFFFFATEDIANLRVNRK